MPHRAPRHLRSRRVTRPRMSAGLGATPRPESTRLSSRYPGGSLGDDEHRVVATPSPPSGGARRIVLTSKADFTGAYNAADPRDYYSSLGDLDYQIPTHGAPVFRRLADALSEHGSAPTVLDVCCSYGINAALLNHDITFDEIRDHYAHPRTAGLSSDELVAADRALFAQRRRSDALEVIGLDVSRAAVDYAVHAGLLDHGLVVDLEADHPAGDLDAVNELLAQVDLVTVTGGVGYVQRRTFERIVAASLDEPPWIAALTLRWVDFDPIARSLERYGLVTERLDGYLVRQRRFADDEERAFVFESLDAHGVAPTSIEHEGWHCAELFVARPDAAPLEPISSLLDAAGASAQR